MSSGSGTCFAGCVVGQRPRFDDHHTFKGYMRDWFYKAFRYIPATAEPEEESYGTPPWGKNAETAKQTKKSAKNAETNSAHVSWAALDVPVLLCHH